jgi:hypothetical protein
MRKLLSEAEQWEEMQLYSGKSSQYKISSQLEMTPFNERLLLQEREFNNPLILERFIDEFGLNEIGSNYPRELYNPHDKATEEFFEEL